jgi:polygalacturonase
MASIAKNTAMKYLFTSLLLIATYISFGQLSIDITTLGASTGLGDNAPFIQKAIDSVSHHGGGEVIINGGSFTSNTIILKSNVTLRVTHGSTLLALPVDTFPDIPYNTRSWMDTYTDKSLIFAEDANNIRITGGGTIDGNGNQLVYLLDSSDVKRRPFGMRIHGVDTFQVDSITLRQAPQWWGSIDSCQNVHIFNTTVYNQGFSSNDGIDISSCINVLIENCSFDTDDDPLPIKTETRSICRDVMVRHCQMATFERAVKVGCETLGPLVNIHFQDITVVPSSNTTVGAVEVPFNMMYISVADGGSMDSNIFPEYKRNGRQITNLSFHPPVQPWPFL